jgi:hypothetical protein
MRLVVIAIPRSRRINVLMQSAGTLWPDLQIVVVPWIDVISGNADLRAIVQPDDVLRIESPGKDFPTECELLRAADALSRWQIDDLVEERGRMLWPAIWYRGFCNVLLKIESQLNECPAHQRMNHPREIAVMFDKTRTLEFLQQQGVCTPPAIGRVRDYDDLITQMQRRHWSRVFVKLAHGSSASGAIALRMGGGRMQAFTTVELEGEKIYNTRRIRELSSASDIAKVVNAIAQHTAHAEFWLPKAGIDGRTFDLRVVVINGKACHIVTRLSRTPMTNLNLLNDRSDAQRVQRRCGEDNWRHAIASCERTMRAFPHSLYAGIDLIIAPDFHRHGVLEVNAFGDLLPGATWRGMDTCAAELHALLNSQPALAEVR